VSARASRIVLQARTSSRRLPAKALLPMGGLPLAILCAKRLQNAGHDLVLATSADATDDAMARLAERAGIKVFRGDLDDVLSRFVQCAADLADDDVLIRATADNPLPDGAFVNLLVERFLQEGTEYLGTSSPADGLPFGLSGEVFTAGTLRAIAQTACSPLDREHVTPSLRQKAGARGLIRRGQILEEDFSHLRCTVDTLGDYLDMERVFAACADPIRAPWRSFLGALARNRAETAGRDAPATQNFARGAIMLGTAQLGMPYGIANQSGCPSDAEAMSILDVALENGIVLIDTARSYGLSESRIGAALSVRSAGEVSVVTKLAPLSGVTDDSPVQDIVRAVESSVFRSCHALRRRRLDVLLFHRSEDMHLRQGAAMEHVTALQKEGVVGSVGASVYSPEEALQCIADPRIGHLQIPLNLLDRRWTSEAFRKAISKRPDIKVHARSVFLQGLLIRDATVWPKWVSSSKSLVERIVRLCLTLHRRNPIDLCMAYVRAFPWVTTLVLGVERAEQLKELVECARERPLSANEVELVHAELNDVPQRLLNPATW
jgi:spore coat polysaccharide biosynthesis protein SpsF